LLDESSLPKADHKLLDEYRARIADVGDDFDG